MIKTIQVTEDLVLLVGKDATSLFDYFDVDDLHGLNRQDCLDRILSEDGIYIEGMLNLYPNTNKQGKEGFWKYKTEGGLPLYYLFINNKALTGNTLKDFGLIFHECTHYQFRKYYYDLYDNEEAIITDAEYLAIKVYKMLF